MQRATTEEMDHIAVKRKVKKAFKRHHEPPRTTVDFYRIGRILGKGASGKVNLAMHKLTRKICAVKSIKKKKVALTHEQRADVLKLEQEVFMVQQARLRHPNVVQMFEYVQTDDYHLLFMEICTGGDLLGYIRRRRKLDENMARRFFGQLMHGLAYLHARKIVHRDVKLENILLTNLG
jgi:serine/threonine protein kinase